MVVVVVVVCVGFGGTRARSYAAEEVVGVVTIGKLGMRKGLGFSPSSLLSSPPEGSFSLSLCLLLI